MKLSRLLTGLFITGCILLGTAQAKAATVTIKADEDMYFSTNTMQNTDGTLFYVRNSSTNIQTAYLKFILNASNAQDKILLDALAAGETITSASLNAYKYSGSGSSNTKIYYSYDDIWSETSNSPQTFYMTPEIGSFGTIGYGWNSTSITDLAYMINDIVDKDVPAGFADNRNTIITLALSNFMISSSSSWESFKSTEYSCGQYSPYLTITTAEIPAPEPSSLILGSLALAAAGRRIRRK